MLHSRLYLPRRPQQRGVVLFMTLILLLILTILGVSIARMQTVEERLAQNDNNHQLALQTAEAALRGALDADGGDTYQPAAFADGTPGLGVVASEITTAPFSTLGYGADWAHPGTDTIVYDGVALADAPVAAQPQFVIEVMAPAVPPGCNAGSGGGGYPSNAVTIHRITAHSAGGDGSASATVQTIRIGNC